MARMNGYTQSPEHVQRRIASRLATLRVKPKPVTKEWLAEEYVSKGRDCVQIGAELGRDPKTIWAWLRHYDIPTRPRGSNVAQLPRGRKPGFKLTPDQRQVLREARARDGRVPYLKNGKHWLHHEGAKAPNWKGGITPERQAFYATDEWRAAVKAVWARANATCERCEVAFKEVRKRGAFHIHHIVSFANVGMRTEPSNLALLCKPCHLFVHSKLNINGQFLKDPPA